ncbi:VirB3 family type IV secretion system protein [Martelella sp. HB161492]|uniref:type IV secretion system protein VirB3 n=1 Tax=Martelella sp. HB161492 TaxID=2720726 RepID=UPI0015918CC9|nr:VirB3 family type IV secretion system protein [Martelella sp. HB161492]
MTLQTETIYTGLLRPTKVFGLPSGAFAVLMVTSLLAFMWSESFFSLAFAIPGYAFLYGLTQWDPHFFTVISVTTRNFGVCRNRRIWGGFSYEP